jgi:hypothetical protein
MGHDGCKGAFPGFLKMACRLRAGAFSFLPSERPRRANICYNIC